jgi:uncharacterized protein with GYD domain
MPKYLFAGSYTVAGTKGLIEDGGTKRRVHIQQVLEELGGKLEVFYFAFGEIDVFAIADLPDTVTATATSLAINKAGGVQVTLTPLITPEEIDQASKKTVAYQSPGTLEK